MASKLGRTCQHAHEPMSYYTVSLGSMGAYSCSRILDSKLSTQLLIPIRIPDTIVSVLNTLYPWMGYLFIIPPHLYIHPIIRYIHVSLLVQCMHSVFVMHNSVARQTSGSVSCGDFYSMLVFITKLRSTTLYCIVHTYVY